MPQLLTPQEVAEWLNVTTRTLYNWRTKGVGPKYVTVEGCIRYAREAVDEYLEANERNAS